MEKQGFKLSYYLSDGDLVRELSKSPAAPEDIMASLRFMSSPGVSIVVELANYEIKDGKAIEMSL